MKQKLKSFWMHLWMVSVLCTLLLCIPSKLFADVTNNSTTSNSVVVPTTLKVVLVQFNDVKWNQFWDGSQWQSFTYQHTMSDFQELLTSLNTRPNFNSDGDPVFGSFRDYFYVNSRQTYSPTVIILNNTDANGNPVWLELSGNKSIYDSGSFISAADAAATNAGFDISTSSSVRLCYIYAGNWVSNIGVFATALHGSRMVVPERFNRSHP